MSLLKSKLLGIRPAFAIVLIAFFFLIGCKDKNIIYPNELLSYEFKASDNVSLNEDIQTVLGADNTFEAVMPEGTDFKNLIARFEISGAKLVMANFYDGIEQISGETSNDFTITDELFMDVYAENGIIQTYYVKLVSSNNSMDSIFLKKENNPSLLDDVKGVKNDNGFSFVLPVGTDIENLVANFGHNGKEVTVDGNIQENGVTSNNFSSPIKYVVTSEAGGQKEYEISVTTSEFVWIPDDVFREYLLNTVPNAFRVDQFLDVTHPDVTSLAKIDVSSRDINSIAGIRFFNGITELNCYNNHIRVIDLTKNIKLEILDIGNNNLVELIISKNTQLKRLDCRSNHIKMLNIANNVKLIYVSCALNNLTELDITSLGKLEELYCYNNQLKSLDVTKNKLLISLWCSANQIEELDISYNENLISLYCYSNKLTVLDLSNNPLLDDLNCELNDLATLDLKNNYLLKKLECSHNDFEELDLSSNVELNWLRCTGSQLSSLDLSLNKKIERLFLTGNNFTFLDISYLPVIERFDCYNNPQLTSLGALTNSNSLTINLDDQIKCDPTLKILKEDKGDNISIYVYLNGEYQGTFDPSTECN